jgi:hypothetical protein
MKMIAGSSPAMTLDEYQRDGLLVDALRIKFCISRSLEGDPTTRRASGSF